MNEELLKEILARQEKNSEFNYGIQTAYSYVKNLEDCVGHGLCYRYGAKGNTSFDDVKKAAKKKLTYSNSDLEVEDIYVDWKKRFSTALDIELPKNTLMVFKHILTTPRKDRDGDILRTQGAKPDPKMTMLWQHVHTLPIGKMMLVDEHTSSKLSLVSAIVDVNELAHDAAVMVDNKMGRFSHGFKALDFSKIKEERGETTSGGFDVKSFEILEESLVSVPANVDAEVEEIMLDLIEGDKLTSSMMKSYGKTIRESRNRTISGPSNFGDKNGSIDINLNLSVNGEGTKGAGEESTKNSGGDCSCGGGGSSKETNDNSAGEGKAEDKERMMECPECGGKMEDGVCKSCGYEHKTGDDKDKETTLDGEKFYGRLEGSWEWAEEKLAYGVRQHLLANDVSLSDDDYAWLVSTYPDYAVIACQKRNRRDFDYYKAMWNGDTKNPEFVNGLKPVDIEVNTSLLEKTKHLWKKGYAGDEAEVEGGMTCPQCGEHKLDASGTCQHCGYIRESGKSFDGEKAGRVLSKANYNKLKEVNEDLKEIGEHCSTRSGKALCSKCSKSIMEVIKSADKEDEEQMNMERFAQEFIAKATPADRKKMLGILTAFDSIERTKAQTKEIKSFLKEATLN